MGNKPFEALSEICDSYFNGDAFRSLIGLAVPWPLKLIIVNVIGLHPLPKFLNWMDSFFPNENYIQLAAVAALSYLAITAIGSFASYIDSFYNEKVAQYIADDLRRKMYHHLQHLSLSYYDTHQTGKLISTITADVSTIQSFASATLLNILVSVFEPLGSLKLVNQCKTSETYQQYLISELLIYKMFNLLTEKSFRVRLINLKIMDTTGKKKTITENAFLMENEKNLAKRNTCTQIKTKKIKYNETDRRQMTLVDIFEYMIGNTDWSVSGDHNIQFLHSEMDSLSLAYVVPYDFDCSGFVNADYAKPDSKLNISTVQERLYRGFPRTLDEINEALDIFKKQEKNIYALIANCNLLNLKTKKSLTSYLDIFLPKSKIRSKSMTLLFAMRGKINESLFFLLYCF